MMKRRGQTPPPNMNYGGRQNQNFNRYDNRANPNYYQNPQRPNLKSNTYNKKAKQDSRGLSLLITLVSILVVLIIAYIVLYINVFSFKSEITDVLTSSGNSNVEMISDIKVDDSHYVYVFNNGGELSASYIQVKGSGEDKSYKCLKRCDTLNLETYSKDMQNKKMDYSSKGDFHFSLDFSGSEQFSQFEEYFSENNIKDYEACPVNIEGINQIFIVWMWNE